MGTEATVVAVIADRPGGPTRLEVDVEGGADADPADQADDLGVGRVLVRLPEPGVAGHGPRVVPRLVGTLQDPHPHRVSLVGPEDGRRRVTVHRRAEHVAVVFTGEGVVRLIRCLTEPVVEGGVPVVEALLATILGVRKHAAVQLVRQVLTKFIPQVQAVLEEHRPVPVVGLARDADVDLLTRGQPRRLVHEPVVLGVFAVGQSLQGVGLGGQGAVVDRGPRERVVHGRVRRVHHQAGEQAVVAMPAHVAVVGQVDGAQLAGGDVVRPPAVEDRLARADRLVAVEPDHRAVRAAYVVAQQRGVQRDPQAGGCPAVGVRVLQRQRRVEPVLFPIGEVLTDRGGAERRVLDCELAGGIDHVVEGHLHTVALVDVQHHRAGVAGPHAGGRLFGRLTRQHHCVHEAVRVVVAELVVGDLGVDRDHVVGRDRRRHRTGIPRLVGLGGRRTRLGEVGIAVDRLGDVVRQRQQVLHALAEHPHDAPAAEPQVVGGGRRVQVVADAVLADPAIHLRDLEVERLGDTDRLRVDQRRLRVVGTEAPSVSVHLDSMLLLLRPLDHPVFHPVTGIRLEDRGLGITVHPRAELVGRIDRLTLMRVA